MAKKHLGIVLTTRRYDMYRFVVYQYEDTTIPFSEGAVR